MPQPDANDAPEKLARRKPINCRSCRFWHKPASRDEYGECRRHAPVPVSNQAGLAIDALWQIAKGRADNSYFPVATYPLVAGYEWCGEFERRERRP